MQIDIQKFVCTDKSRPNLCSPWTVNGYHYATNGRALIKTPATDGVEYPIGEWNRPNADDCLVTAAAVSWVPVDSFENTGKDVACDECLGIGKYWNECHECGGEGDSTCPICGHGCECDNCNNTGKTFTDAPCEDCKGTKRMMKFGNIVTPSGLVDGKYLDLFRGFEMGIVPKLMEVIPMRCGDIVGALMPIRTAPGCTEGEWAGLHEAVLAARKAVGL